MLQGKRMHVSCPLLLVLMVWTVATEVLAHGDQKCNFSKYRNLPLRYQKDFKNVRDSFVRRRNTSGINSKEDSMLLSDQKCNTKVFHRNWEVKNLTMHDRVILVEEELNFTIHILENFGDAKLSEELLRPLEDLRHIQEDLGNCIRDQLHSHQRSKRLTRWLQKFHLAKKTETPGCLEASVIFNLFQLLNNLECMAYMNDCE